MRRSYAFEATVALIIVVLLFALSVMILSNPRQEAAGWELPGNGSVDYMFVGGNDTLYAFRGNDIAAVRSDGSIAWTISIPAEWRLSNSWIDPGYTIPKRPIVVEDSGSLYLFAVHNLTEIEIEMLGQDHQPPAYSRQSVIIAISPDGNIRWEYPFHIQVPPDLMKEDTTMPYTVALEVRNGNVYLFHDYTEEIIGENLTRVNTLYNVAAPAAIDEEGRVYTVSAITPYNIYYAFTQMPSDVDMSDHIGVQLSVLPTSVINAYGPDGSPIWSRDIGHSAVRQSMWDNAWEEYSKLPLYIDGTLYVPVKDGVIALDRDGNTKWECHLPEEGHYSLFEMMPVDDRGNIYVKKTESLPMGHSLEYIYIISPDGNATKGLWPYAPPGSLYGEVILPVPMDARNGIIYALNSTRFLDAKTFDWIMWTKRFNPDRLIAFDVKSGAELWNFTVPASDKHVLRLTRENLREALPDFSPEMAEQTIIKESKMGWNPDVPFFQGDTGRIQVYPGGNVTYLNYYFAIYESPIVYGKSRCIYARSLYAIDENGQLLWKKPVEGLVTAMAANNSTFFYGTNDGKIGTVTGNVMVAGIAIIAAVYLFIRFVMLGAVTRARNRLDKNENRKEVLKFIIDNPGATAVDMARALRMNLGTIRYHLFILNLNHKIVGHKEDGKFLRYFTNAGTYTPEERSILSLMRREPMRKTLAQLMEKPGLSNVELSQRLAISTTSTHHHLNELMVRGIVDKVPNDDRSYAYFVKEEYRQQVTRMMDLL